MSQHGKPLLRGRSRRSTASASTSPPRPSRSSRASQAPSSTSRSRCTCAPGLNVRHADEQLRGTIALPNGLGKDVKIAVFAQGDKAREAEEAGADVVGARGPRQAHPGRASTTSTSRSPRPT